LSSKNANVILTCGFLELVSLCTVIRRKIHIPERTTKWPPRLIFAGAVTASKLALFNTKTCDKTCDEHVTMWAGHVSLSFRWVFDFFPLSRRTLRYYVCSALDFGEFKRCDGSIYRNLRELSLSINTTWLWDVNRGNTYILMTLVD